MSKSSSSRSSESGRELHWSTARDSVHTICGNVTWLAAQMEPSTLGTSVTCTTKCSTTPSTSHSLGARIFSFLWRCLVQHSSCTASTHRLGFDVYNIPDALYPEAPMDGSPFLNGLFVSLRCVSQCLFTFFQMHKRVLRFTRLRAKTGRRSLIFRLGRVTPLVSNCFLAGLMGNSINLFIEYPYGDPSEFGACFHWHTKVHSRPMSFSRRRVSTCRGQRNWILRMVRPMAFLTELATNATARNIPIVIYSGNDDSLVPHFGSQSGFLSRSFMSNCANTRI